MPLPTPDANNIGRYAEATAIPAQFSGYMNLGLIDVSASITALKAAVAPCALLTKNSTGWAFPNDADTQLISTYFSTTMSAGVTVTTGADTRLTILTAGRYLIFNSLNFAPHATNARLVRINKNSATHTTNPLLFSSMGGWGGASSVVAGVTIASLAVNDVLRFWGYQNSGGTLALNTGADQRAGSAFGCYRLGP
jgi:hypothetical protein